MSEPTEAQTAARELLVNAHAELDALDATSSELDRRWAVFHVHQAREAMMDADTAAALSDQLDSAGG